MRKLKAANEMDMMPSAQLTRCRSASSTGVKVAGLTTAIRESYLKQIADLLKANYLDTNEQDPSDSKLVYRDFEDCGVEIEYRCFSNNKALILYRRNLATESSTIKNHTTNKQMHPMLKHYKPKTRNILGGDAKDYESKLKSMDPHFGFQKASELIKVTGLTTTTFRKKSTMKKNPLTQTTIGSFFNRSKTSGDSTEILSQEDCSNSGDDFKNVEAIEEEDMQSPIETEIENIINDDEIVNAAIKEEMVVAETKPVAHTSQIQKEIDEYRREIEEMDAKLRSIPEKKNNKYKQKSRSRSRELSINDRKRSPSSTKDHKRRRSRSKDRKSHKAIKSKRRSVSPTEIKPDHSFKKEERSINRRERDLFGDSPTRTQSESNNLFGDSPTTSTKSERSNLFGDSPTTNNSDPSSPRQKITKLEIQSPARKSRSYNREHENETKMPTYFTQVTNKRERSPNIFIPADPTVKKVRQNGSLL